MAQVDLQLSIPPRAKVVSKTKQKGWTSKNFRQQTKRKPEQYRPDIIIIINAKLTIIVYVFATSNRGDVNKNKSMMEWMNEWIASWNWTVGQVKSTRKFRDAERWRNWLIFILITSKDFIS